VKVDIQTLLPELKVRLGAIYGERLRGVYLYGSYARSEADEESDVDVLIVLDRLPVYGAEIDRTSHLMASLSLEYGATVSCVFSSEQDWSSLETPFLDNVREEAAPV
jgi:type I restriction enzyme S subunit